MIDALPAGMMELSQAALIVQRRVFAATLQAAPDSLDVIATALSGYLAIFGWCQTERRMLELAEADFASGAFRRGATRFDFRENRKPIIALAVRKEDFERALKVLMARR